MMSKWLFTSQASDVDGRVVKNDVRVGGMWLIKDRRNQHDYIGDGEYLEIDRPHRLVFTFRMEQFSPTVDRIVVQIEPLEQGSQLTLTHEITVPRDETMSPQEIEIMLAEDKKSSEHGWNEMFDLLVKSLS
jgi:uncharacterized protein YndB with AHSA1/START domain